LGLEDGWPGECPAAPSTVELRALECEQMARAARDPEVKRQLEYLAFEWRQMAEQAERYGW
jgi:hypothetical protein